jgi:predicted PurR-regulated permease PerM
MTKDITADTHPTTEPADSQAPRVDGEAPVSTVAPAPPGAPAPVSPEMPVVPAEQLMRESVRLQEQAIAPPSTLPSQGTLARWLLALLALIGVGWLLWEARAAMTPFIIGLVLAYLLTPIVNSLGRYMPRSLAILIVYLGGIGLIVVSFAFIIPPVVGQTQALINSIPSMGYLQTKFNELLQEYQSRVPPAVREPIDQGVANALNTAQANITNYLQSAGTFLLNRVLEVINTVTFLIGFLIIPIWLFYILNDQEQGRRFIDGLLHPRARSDFWNIWNMINRVLSNYIRGQLTLGVIVGATVGVGLMVLDLIPGIEIDYILLLAIVAGVTELVPIIGPIIGAIPGVLIGLAAGGLTTGLAVLVLYILVQQLENNFLVPRVIGESVGVHPAILTVALIAMGQVFGLIGIILSAPAAAIARDLFVYIYHRLGGGSATEANGLVAARNQVQEQAAS